MPQPQRRPSPSPSPSPSLSSRPERIMYNMKYICRSINITIFRGTAHNMHGMCLTAANVSVHTHTQCTNQIDIKAETSIHRQPLIWSTIQYLRRQNWNTKNWNELVYSCDDVCDAFMCARTHASRKLMAFSREKQSSNCGQTHCGLAWVLAWLLALFRSVWHVKQLIAGIDYILLQIQHIHRRCRWYRSTPWPVFSWI